MHPRDVSLLCDYYEYTMSNGYAENGIGDRIAYFDIFFRHIPDNGGFAVVAGLEQIVDYIMNLKFSEDDIEFMRSKGIFGEKFLDFLKNFRFTGDLYAIPEGTPVFPGEPVITVRAPAMQAQILETFLLMTFNHQTLIATKASRIVRAAKGRAVLEFGSRRAHGMDAAVYGARAAYIAGCKGSACTVDDKLFGIPASGTMAHSWVQMFDSEYDAFKAFCELYSDNATLLVDTYNTLKSGIPNAIRVFKELKLKKCAIRMDSGDLAFMSKIARKMLDDAGLNECNIVLSNSLDEWLIQDLLRQGAEADAFGVGDKLITSYSDPLLGGVYKLAAVEDSNGNIVPKIKISDNVEKMTTPHFKKIYRLYDSNGKAIADLLCLHDESIDEGKPLELFDPDAIWKRKVITGFKVRELMISVIKNGEIVGKMPALDEIRKYHEKEMDTIWDEIKRFSNPHKYIVDMSQRLWDVRNSMITEGKKG